MEKNKELLKEMLELGVTNLYDIGGKVSSKKVYTVLHSLPIELGKTLDNVTGEEEPGIYPFRSGYAGFNYEKMEDELGYGLIVVKNI